MKESFATINMPVYAWRVQIAYSTWLMVQQGKGPNAFHRLMQRLILGFKWERL